MGATLLYIEDAQKGYSMTGELSVLV